MVLNPISSLNLPTSLETFSKASSKEAHSNKANTGVVENSNSLKLESNKKSSVKDLIDKILSNNSTTKEAPKLETMQARLSDIQRRGKLLLHHPSSMKSYVKDMKDFLGDLRDHAYSAKYKDDLFQRMDIVDSQLDELSDELLNSQQQEMALVNSLGELQGLLVDVFA